MNVTFSSDFSQLENREVEEFQTGSGCAEGTQSSLQLSCCDALGLLNCCTFHLYSVSRLLLLFCAGHSPVVVYWYISCSAVNTLVTNTGTPPDCCCNDTVSHARDKIKYFLILALLKAQRPDV